MRAKITGGDKVVVLPYLGSVDRVIVSYDIPKLDDWWLFSTFTGTACSSHVLSVMRASMRFDLRYKGGKSIPAQTKAAPTS